MNARIHRSFYRDQVAAADKAIGQNWPYGIFLTSGWLEHEETELYPPRWRPVSPLGIDVYGYEITYSSYEPPAVDIYSRAQYEIACRAARIVAPADVALSAMVEPDERLDWRNPATPAQNVAARLARRRLRGIAYEARAGIRHDRPGIAQTVQLIRRFLTGDTRR